MKIIQSRLEGVPGNIVDSDAVQFASRKVAAVSGDARRALDICRRAVELAEAEAEHKEGQPETPSKKQHDVIGIKSTGLRGRVTIATVKRAINEATTSPLQQYLRGLPLSSKLLLAAIMAKVQRTGLGESVLGEVVEEAKRIAKMANIPHVQNFLLKEGMRTAGPAGLLPLTMNSEVPRVLAIGAAAIDLTEAGVIGLEARKGERTGKVRLNIGVEEVKLALKDDPEVRGLGF